MTVLRAKTFRNILYSGIGKGLTLTCSGVANLFMARKLAPTDYGLVGFAAIVTGFLVQFSDMGVGNAAVRRTEFHRADLDTAFTLKLALGCFAFIAALLIAPLAHHFFEHAATGTVIRILALNFLISSIGFAPLVILTREMRYRALMVPAVAGALVQTSFVIILLLGGWSFWSVIAANVGGAFANGLVLQFTRTIPIRLHLDWTLARDYLRFGIPLFGAGLLVFLIFNLDNFLVGASMGSVQLGYYALAFTWGSFICVALSSTVNNVLFSAFSSIQNDIVSLRHWYLKTIELVAFIAVIANTSLFANAHLFLVTFLGHGSGKWLPATLALRILCVYGIFRTVIEPVGPCLMARGQTHTTLKAAVLAGAVEVALLLFALKTGRIEVVAAVVLLAYILQAAIYGPFLYREFAVGAGDIIRRTWPIIPAFILGSMVTFLLPDSFGSTYGSLGIRALFTAVVVAVTHGSLSRFRCFHDIGGMISQNLAQ